MKALMFFIRFVRSHPEQKAWAWAMTGIGLQYDIFCDEENTPDILQIVACLDLLIGRLYLSKDFRDGVPVQN